MIIYRNPIEQWFWEGGWFWIGVTCIVFLAACILLDKYNAWKRRNRE